MNDDLRDAIYDVLKMGDPYVKFHTDAILALPIMVERERVIEAARAQRAARQALDDGPWEAHPVTWEAWVRATHAVEDAVAALDAWGES